MLAVGRGGERGCGSQAVRVRLTGPARGKRKGFQILWIQFPINTKVEIKLIKILIGFIKIWKFL
jgi:hypothetical protein